MISEAARTTLHHCLWCSSNLLTIFQSRFKLLIIYDGIDIAFIKLGLIRHSLQLYNKEGLSYMFYSEL
jgi:hypothetical protein